MFVLMDMEWYQQNGENMPVQIAAIRTDDRFQCLKQFYRRIRPERLQGIRWGHVCFRGSEPQQFRTSEALGKVMADLRNWLRGDDVILWWHESSENLFRRAYARIFGQEPKAMGVLHECVGAHLDDGAVTRGSAWALAGARGLGVDKPEHHSLHDVKALLLLLKHVGIPVSRYAEEGCMRRRVWQPFLQTGKTKEPAVYFFDPKGGLLHRAGCPDARPGVGAQFCDSMEYCVRHRMEPCGCCRKDMDAFINDSRRAYPVYINRRTGMAHLESCFYVKNTHVSKKTGHFSLKAALVSGCRLCSRCAGISSYYRAEKKEIDDFCGQNRLICECREDGLHIISRNEIWRIVMDMERNEPTLYHHNTRGNRKKADDAGLTDFHVQGCAWESILEYLRYIKRHEKAVVRREKKSGRDGNRFPNTKKGKKERQAAQRAKRKRQIAYVCGLLDELEACGK